jgi:hypothetical protein
VARPSSSSSGLSLLSSELSTWADITTGTPSIVQNDGGDTNSKTKVDHRMDSLDYEEEKSSKTIFKPSEQIQMNKHIRFYEDESRNESSIPLSQKRRLGTNCHDENTLSDRASPDNEVALDGDNDGVHANEISTLSHPDNINDNNNKRPRDCKNGDSQNIGNTIDTTTSKKNPTGGERLSKRNKTQGTMSATVKSTTASDENVVQSIIHEIETASTVAIPLKPASMMSTASSILGTMVQKSAEVVTSLINRKISSPDRRGKPIASQMSMRTRKASFNSTSKTIRVGIFL